MTYRFARKDDIPALARVWENAFPDDSEKEIFTFLKTVRPEEECLLADRDGQVVAMVFMLPACLRTGTSRLPLQYIYAAATLSDFRGQGIFGGLLTAALSVAQQRGCAASFLRPAEPSLRGYYQRFGYEPFFYCRTFTGTAGSQPTAAVSVSSEEYACRREKRLPETAVLWDSRFMGGTVLLGNDGEAGCAVCDSRDGVLFIRELLCDPEDEETLAASLAAAFGCGTYQCRVPAARAEGEPFGLLRPLTDFDGKNSGIPYMGLALD